MSVLGLKSVIINETPQVVATLTAPLTNALVCEGAPAMPKFNPIPKLTPELIEHFWSKVDKTSDPNGCHLWTGRIHYEGYGHFDINQVSFQVHRIAWTLEVGPIPDGMLIDHVRARGCVNRHCVNVAHLEPVPHRINVLRGDGPTAKNAAKTHCIHGHELIGDNIYERADRPGTRECRACAIQRASEHRRQTRNADKARRKQVA